jgi:hypothetical protein
MLIRMDCALMMTPIYHGKETGQRADKWLAHMSVQFRLQYALYVYQGDLHRHQFPANA